MSSQARNKKTVYAYLGPAGTFTELALRQVKAAVGQEWQPVLSVPDALAAVLSGKAHRAIVPVESSVEGGVSATLDALATTDGLQIYGEYLVPVNFNLVARPGVKLSDVKTIAAHPVAYAQVRKWLGENIKSHKHFQSTSNAAAASDLWENEKLDAAVSTPNITDHYMVKVIAKNIADTKHAETRFIEVGKKGALPKRTGHDKTSVIVELPTDRPGALLEMLEQFAVRGVNLSRIESRPVGDRLGRYRFNVDANGHAGDEAVAEALQGLFRFSPKVTFLGSYPRADKKASVHEGNNTSESYVAAKRWWQKAVSK
jgi:prephenate dehydratase